VPERRRTLAFTAVAVACVAALVAYLVAERVRTSAAADPGPPGGGLTVAAVQRVPHLVVRDTRPGPTYGDIALIPLSDPAGPRADVPVKCERVAATRTRVICLQQTSTLGPTYRAVFMDGRFRQTGIQDLPGTPSRARVSSGGSYTASTVFRSGESYADVTFSVQTVITRTAGQQSLGDLETWTTTKDGARVTAQDRNFWGVTFIGDGPGFYATMATGGVRYLVKGDARARTMTVVAENGACPSVSADGASVVMKEQDPVSKEDHLVDLDLATGHRTALPEGRVVDDQVTWDGSSTVLYAVGKGIRTGVAFDVWTAPVDGAAARLLVPDAASPSVVRPAS
jgi:hypothetical protein